ncbi:MAG: TIGR04141 family sporadically distributed protein [Alphaproteobacteria bacterium]|jgi:uncharacterized protein (TIGR04141 family)|nr:TIGR04141 family sporadically distributed protein [Alphaproteobacteria bacterium]
MSNKRNIKLNLNLIKGKKINDIPSLISKYSEGQRIILSDMPDNVFLYKKTGGCDYPKWIDTIDKKLKLDVKSNFSKILSQGISIFIYLKHKNEDYIFVFSFGTGFHSVKREYFKPYFGLYTALKAVVKGEKIKGDRSRALKQNPENKDSQFGKGIDKDTFYLMMSENEILQELSIKSDKNHPLYKSLIGNLSTLKINLKYDFINENPFTDLEKSLKELIDLSDSITEEDKDYLFKGVFPVEITEEMKSLIDSKVKSFDEVYMFYPKTNLDFTSLDKYRFRGEDFDELEDILDKYYNDFKWTDFEGEEIELLNDEGEHITENWSFIECLYCEFYSSNNEKVYFLSHSKVHQVKKDKYEVVNRNINVALNNDFSINNDVILKTDAEIKRLKEAGETHISKERIFNTELSNSISGELWDEVSKQISMPSGRIEICDVLDINKKAFIHSKIYRGISDLSHLFLQGNNSINSYLLDKEGFINKSKEKYPQSKIDNDFSVVRYLILGKKKEQLTFFAKMSLSSIIEDLNLKQIKVELLFENRFLEIYKK